MCSKVNSFPCVWLGAYLEKVDGIILDDKKALISQQDKLPGLFKVHFPRFCRKQVEEIDSVFSLKVQFLTKKVKMS